MLPSLPKLRSRASVRTGTALLVSLFLHLPLMPIVLLIGFLSRIDRVKEAAKQDYQANEVTVSVELLPASPRQPSPQASNEAAAQAAELASLPRGEGEELADGTGAEAKEEEAAVEPSLEASDEDGSLGTLEGEANVTLSLWMSTLRQHELAVALRSMLGCGKLGSTLKRAQVDAFDDLEAAVFAGPRLDDPTQYTAALSHRLPEARLRKAFARLTWPEGRWLDESAVRIRAAGARRVVFERGPKLVLATPEPVFQKLRASSRKMAIPSSNGRAFSLSLREPSMALARIGLDLPSTLTRMRLDAHARPNGGVELRIRFEDRDEATARENAPKLAAEVDVAIRQLRQVGALSKMLAPILGTRNAMDFEIPRFRFTVEGASIVGMASIDAAQASSILSKLTPFVCETDRPATSGR